MTKVPWPWTPDEDDDDYEPPTMRSLNMANFFRGYPAMTMVSVSSQAQANVLENIVEERRRQDDKWGAQRNQNIHLWHTILSEEVGEVAEGTLSLQDAVRGVNLPHLAAERYSALRKELVQVAAVAVATIEDLDEQMRLTGKVIV